MVLCALNKHSKAALHLCLSKLKLLGMHDYFKLVLQSVQLVIISSQFLAPVLISVLYLAHAHSMRDGTGGEVNLRYLIHLYLDLPWAPDVNGIFLIFLTFCTDQLC